MRIHKVPIPPPFGFVFSGHALELRFVYSCPRDCYEQHKYIPARRKKKAEKFPQRFQPWA